MAGNPVQTMQMVRAEKTAQASGSDQMSSAGTHPDDEVSFTLYKSYLMIFSYIYHKNVSYLLF